MLPERRKANTLPHLKSELVDDVVAALWWPTVFAMALHLVCLDFDALHRFRRGLPLDWHTSPLALFTVGYDLCLSVV